jgi:BED zinc finger
MTFQIYPLLSISAKPPVGPAPLHASSNFYNKRVPFICINKAITENFVVNPPYTLLSMPLEPGTIEVPLASQSLIPLSSPVTVTAAAAAAAAAAAVSVPPHNPRERKLRSAVWNDFSKQRRPDGSCVAICNHCQKQLTASSRSGTTHLRNHLAVCLSTKPRPGPGRRKKLVVRRLLLPTHPRLAFYWK